MPKNAAPDFNNWPNYTDGTRVESGDSIRYHQAPGGVFAPGPWRAGIAVPVERFGYPSLAMQGEDGRLHNLVGHVIERDRHNSTIGA